MASLFQILRLREAKTNKGRNLMCVLPAPMKVKGPIDVEPKYQGCRFSL